MNADYARLRERLSAASFLPDKPEETPDTTLRALWYAAAGQPKSAVAAGGGELPALDACGAARLDALIGERLAGTPLAHLTGRQHFMGLEMIAGPGALVPRKETELLARTAVALMQEVAGPATFVDVCTGCGNVALAVARAVPSARVFGADISEEAIALACRNAEWLGLDGRAGFRTGDLLAPFDGADFLGNVDVLTCNPPYISSGKVGQMAEEIALHEPRLAFDGGPLGVTILMRLLQEAPRFLKPSGALAFEVGLGQGPALVRRLKASDAYRDVRELTDDRGDVRAVAARRREG
ncbi:MAG TPA: HemK family protein methyltransferase [Rhodanobacteraceae bacterium]|nr:HemK family protein methyltransferase [Rhodanobacteraceae bacterium]